MKKIYLYIALASIFLIAVACWWLVQDMNRNLDQPLALASPRIITISPGTSLKKIGRQLSAKGWLSHPYYLVFEARRRGLAGRIKAGEYELKPGISPRGVLDLIVSGIVVQYPLTIPEGWTFVQIMDAIQKNAVLDHTLDQTEESYVMDKLGHGDDPAEGRFFPDTYHFPRGTTDLEFLQRAFDTMTRVLMEEWEDRDGGLPYKSSYEALIMASIIEKETSVEEERYKIAGVFVRRLQQGMLLQTDPTVIYALGRNFDGDIRNRDLRVDSPYNTYTNKGLPPTPIAAPGRACIRAALHPENGTALYFVAMDDGHHYFSDTLAEHNKAVAKYQLNNGK